MSKILGGFLIFSSVFFAASVSHAQGWVIGNGGDGYMIGHRLYVYDLIETGNYLAPSFGTNIDPWLESQSKFIPITFYFPRERLVTKLTDINQAYPGLGDYLLIVLKSYNWSLVEDLLTAVPNQPGGVVLKHPEWIHEQFANRFGASIRIYSPSWKYMDDDQKVALMIHEAVYSLLKVDCDATQYCLQSAARAREIAGSFFSDAFLAHGPSVVRPYLDQLSIPLALSLDQIRAPTYWTIHLIPPKKSDLKVISLAIAVRQDPSKISDFRNRVCQKLGELSRKVGAYDLESDLQRSPYSTRFISYFPQKDDVQDAFEIRPQEDPLTEIVSFKAVTDESRCLTVLAAPFLDALQAR